MFRKNLVVLLIITIMTTISLTGCAKPIEIIAFDGEKVVVDTEGLSNAQINALKAVESGEKSLMSLVQEGIFNMQQMALLGLMPVDGMGDKMGRENLENLPKNIMDRFTDFDFSTVDIETLNLDKLTEEQVEAIKKVVSGEMTIQTLIEEEIITMMDLREIGFMQGGKGFGGGLREKSDDQSN